VLRIPILLATSLLAGCASQPCASMPAMNELLTGAALVRVDIYDGAQAHCRGSLVDATGEPLKSQTFPGGAAVRLDVSPGQRTIAMTTFSDAAGTMPSGSACTESNIAGGRGACLSLSLVAIDHDAGSGCAPANDTCPTGQFCGSDFTCQVGCKSAGDCSDAAKPKCDTSRHQCVQCLGAGDCQGGQVCSPSGVCTEGCDPAVGCSGGRACCTNVCVDTLTDPLNCNGCGMACTGGDTMCCNGKCANPSTSTQHCGMCGNACSTLNATPTCSAGVCNWTCTGNFVHCGTGNTGCETASDTVSNCGGCGNVCMPTNASTNMCMSAMTCSYMCQMGFLDCLKVGANTDGCETSANTINTCGGCTNVCDSAHSMGATCPAGICVYTGCAPGYLDCNQAAPNVDGCECQTAMCCGTACQPVHSNGLGQTYLLMCVPLGLPGMQNTYTLAMATAAADAWSAGTDGTRGCMGGTTCFTRTNSAGTMCGTWCYTKGLAGYVSMAAACTCPTSASPTWN
jgi:hypothetical protein